jgi:ferredoxin
MKVTIDREECIACGACYSDCPEVFEENPEDGWSQIVPQYRVGDELGAGEVPDDLVECARTAEDGCPVEIIHVG